MHYKLSLAASPEKKKKKKETFCRSIRKGDVGDRRAFFFLSSWPVTREGKKKGGV